MIPPFASLEIDPIAAGQIVAAVVMGTLGLYFLLPRPRGRSIALGTFLSLGTAGMIAGFLITTFGQPFPNLVENALFWLFAAGAVGFGRVLVMQSNPARGAISFAFVILSSCGLFLMLAAPFLMAATIIIYMGAIVVTFLFVLMLSQAKGASDENDRSREPLLGSLAGFAFMGLILFTLYVTGPRVETRADAAIVEPLLPATGIRTADKLLLVAAANDLDLALDPDAKPDEMLMQAKQARTRLLRVVGSAGEPLDANPGRTIQDRLRNSETDVRIASIVAQADKVRVLKKTSLDRLETALLDREPKLDEAREQLKRLRGEVLILAGRGELPAKNVKAIGYALYSEHLIAVELAGTLLLVATIGAVAIAQKKGSVA